MIDSIENFIINNIALSICIYYGIVFIILCIYIYFDEDEYNDNTWIAIVFVYIFSPFVIPCLLIYLIGSIPVFIKKLGEKHRETEKEKSKKIVTVTKKYKNDPQKLIDELSKLLKDK